MSKAVPLDDCCGVEVLEMRDAARPEPAPDQVLVAVPAAGINPRVGKIPEGLVREIFRGAFRRGQGSEPKSARRHPSRKTYAVIDGLRRLCSSAARRTRRLVSARRPGRHRARRPWASVMA